VALRSTSFLDSNAVNHIFVLPETNLSQSKIMLRIAISNDENFLVPPAASDGMQERIAAMMRQELKTYPRHDFSNLRAIEEVDSNHCDSPRIGISVEFREKVCEWSYLVVDQLEIDREVVLTSWYFIDRFLCSNQHIDFQPALLRLLSMSALLLASKLNGSRKLSMPYLSGLSRSQFSVKVLSNMEDLLLRSLKWNLYPPTPKAVVRELLALLAARVDNDALKQVSRYSHFFAELSVFDAELVGVQVVDTALASVLNALELSGISESGFIGQSFLQECCATFLKRHVVEDIEFAQYRLWAVYCHTEEYSFSRAFQTFKESENKRQRREEKTFSPTGVAYVLP